jgi:hypothetical protein
VKGNFAGWGAQCKCHTNLGDSLGTICKKQLIMPTDEGRCRIKAWLLSGIVISDISDAARTEHVTVNPRLLALAPEAELDNIAQLHFNLL